MSYPLDNPREEDPPVPFGHYYFETLNISSIWVTPEIRCAAILCQVIYLDSYFQPAFFV